MIYKNRKSISDVIAHNKIIAEIYKGTKLVWQLSRYLLFWKNDSPWNDNERW